MRRCSLFRQGNEGLVSVRISVQPRTVATAHRPVQSFHVAATIAGEERRGIPMPTSNPPLRPLVDNATV